MILSVCIKNEFQACVPDARIIHERLFTCPESRSKTARRLQSGKYFSKGVRAFGDNQDISCRERVVEHDVAAVVFECAHIIIAHDDIAEIPPCRDTVLARSEERR